MSQARKNLAAVLPAAKAPLEVREVELYQPGPHELLVKNEVIAINPVEYKIAKLGIIPLEHPAIIGSTFAGTVEAVGSEVTAWRVGEKVVVSKRFGVKGNQYGAYQRFVVVKDRMICRVDSLDHAETVASLMMNATCVAGLFTGRLGFDRPHFDQVSPSKNMKVLIYGGSSSFGRLAIRYLSQAGYTVITTSSPRNREEVKRMGASEVVDHAADLEVVRKQLVKEGSYEAVVDMISLPSTLSVTSQVVTSQGGGKLYAMNPVSSGVEGVECIFEPWSDCLYEDEQADLQDWVVEKYLKIELLERQTTKNIPGALDGIDEALQSVEKGDGGRLIIHPWQ